MVVRAFVDAAAALGQRLLVVGSLRHALTAPSASGAESTSKAGAGAEAGAEGLLPAHVASVEFAPHGWLFARVACAVHHGGAGTTGAAFRAAVPQLLCPVEYDQFFWAQRAHALGVAPPMLSLAAVTAARVQAAMVSGTQKLALGLTVASGDVRCAALRCHGNAAPGVCSAVCFASACIARLALSWLNVS